MWETYLSVWKKYAVFEGRARRKEFWIFVLINLLISFILAALDPSESFRDATFLTVVGWVFSLAVLIPGIAVTVRRLHDAGHTGWWLLVVLVPLLNLVLLVFCLEGSDEGTNKYGPNPKGVSSEGKAGKVEVENVEIPAEKPESEKKDDSENS